MHALRLIAFAGAIALGGAVSGRAQPGPSGQAAATSDHATAPASLLSRPTAATECNAWPFVVRRSDTDPKAETTAAGPFLFAQTAADGTKAKGLRPVWVQHDDAQGNFRAGYFLYPIFSYTQDENTYGWNVFELLRNSGRRAGAGAPHSELELRGNFELWPFIFWRQTGDPSLSYAAVFPLGGTVKDKLGTDRATWVLFPLYLQTEKHGVLTTSVPWPFVRVTSGAAHGFGLWPLFNFAERPGAWKQRYFLWPLGYDNTTYPAADAPAGTAPKRDVGFLPFYARSTATGYIDENFGWPFFGYTDRTQPTRFHETRYFWPFLVQGRGDNRYVNRWGPFYTHSIVNGYDKTWYAWPLIRHAEWTDRNLAIEKTQLFYFLYWSERQRSAARPNGPAASLTHVWPLYSTWANGAGARQFQLFSPLEVFFPGNDKIREAWSPLFAIARSEQSAPGESRTSLLWNAVTWRRDDASQTREFHLGPLLSVTHRGGARRIAVGNGVVTFQRTPRGSWLTRWFDFPRTQHAGSLAQRPGRMPQSEGGVSKTDALRRRPDENVARPRSPDRQTFAITQTLPR